MALYEAKKRQHHFTHSMGTYKPKMNVVLRNSEASRLFAKMPTGLRNVMADIMRNMDKSILPDDDEDYDELFEDDEGAKMTMNTPYTESGSLSVIGSARLATEAHTPQSEPTQSEPTGTQSMFRRLRFTRIPKTQGSGAPVPAPAKPDKSPSTPARPRSLSEEPAPAPAPAPAPEPAPAVLQSPKAVPKEKKDTPNIEAPPAQEAPKLQPSIMMGVKRRPVEGTNFSIDGNQVLTLRYHGRYITEVSAGTAKEEFLANRDKIEAEIAKLPEKNQVAIRKIYRFFE